MLKSNPKLDKTDLKLLFELDKNSKIAVTSLAKKLKISREIVKYRIKKLTSDGVIKSFTAMINPAKFGYIIYKTYLKLQNLDDEKEKSLLDFLRNHKRVFWLMKADGVYDLMFGVYVENIVQFNDFMIEFLGKFSEFILSRHISNSVYVDIYRKNYLVNKESAPVFWGGIPSKVKIDNLMKKILTLTAEDSRMSVVDLCHKLNSTPKTIISKIKYLEKSNIILGYRLILDLDKLNKENFKAIIYFKDINPVKERKFKEFCKQNPNICYYIKTIGEWDVELDIEIENFKKFNQLVKEIKEKFSDIIRNIDSVYMADEIKGELNIVQNL